MKLSKIAKSANMVNIIKIRGFMKIITATEAKNSFGELLMSAQSEPVSITRNGKEKGVLLSSHEYAAIKSQILQAAVQEGRASGISGNYDINEIKKEAKRRSAK